jgi:class 3 adenylate cyclase
MPGVPHDPRRERLVERWSDLTRWPTAKKTAFAMGVAAVFHVVVPTLALAAFALWAPGVVDVPRFAELFAAWALLVIAISVVSSVVAWRGEEGRWTVYLLIFGYGTFLVVAIMQLGLATSPWFAVVPLVVLLIPIYFDASAGRTAFVFVTVLVPVACVLELSGTVPLAPMMHGRTFESLMVPGWYAGVYVLVFSVFTYVFLLVQLSVWVRDSQRARLEAAHEALSQTSGELARANEMISRYVASQVAEKIRAGRYDEVDRHERRKLTIVFSDIKDFTAMAERLEPEDLSALLNEYLSEMSAIAKHHGGTIDKFVGDAIMVLFGAPVAYSDREQAVRAVRMGTEMQNQLSVLREKWQRHGVEQDVAIRIGVNTGQATVGNFGSNERMDYTAIGRQVNLAARLQAHCEPGRILVSHSTWMLIRDEIACVEKGEIQVKGFEHPVRAYEVAPSADRPSPDGAALPG